MVKFIRLVNLSSNKWKQKSKAISIKILVDDILSKQAADNNKNEPKREEILSLREQLVSQSCKEEEASPI